MLAGRLAARLCHYASMTHKEAECASDTSMHSYYFGMRIRARIMNCPDSWETAERRLHPYLAPSWQSSFRQGDNRGNAGAEGTHPAPNLVWFVPLVQCTDPSKTLYLVCSTNELETFKTRSPVPSVLAWLFPIRLGPPIA